MNKLLLIPALFLFLGNTMSSQCTFDSTITSTPNLGGGNHVQCPNQIIDFTAPAGYDSYQWKYKFSSSGTATDFAGETNNTLSILAGDLGFAYVFVTITDEGCTEDSNDIMFDTWVFQSPAIEHDADTILCYGETSIISNAFGNPVEFRWYRNGMLVQSGVQDFYEVSETGSYLLEVAYAECPDMWFSSGVPVNFNVVGEEVVIEENAGTLYTTGNGASYIWYLDGEEIPGADTDTYLPLETGTYTVEVTFQAGETCIIISEGYYYEVLSSPQNDVLPTVYFLNTIAIDNQFVLKNENRENLLVSFFDASGRQILTKNTSETNNAFSVDTWKKGVYFCVIKTNAHKKTISLIR